MKQLLKLTIHHVLTHLANVTILNTLQTPENQSFSGILRGIKGQDCPEL